MLDHSTAADLGLADRQGKPLQGTRLLARELFRNFGSIEVRAAKHVVSATKAL